MRRLLGPKLRRLPTEYPLHIALRIYLDRCERFALAAAAAFVLACVVVLIKHCGDGWR